MADRQSELAGRDETIETLEGPRTAKRRGEPGQPLREQIRSLLAELELLGREQRSAVEQQETRAARILAALRTTEAELDERSRALAETERRSSAVADDQRVRGERLAEAEQALERRKSVLEAAERSAAEHERQAAAAEQELASRSAEVSREREAVENDRRAVAETTRNVEQEVAERRRAVEAEETALARRRSELDAGASRVAELAERHAEREGVLQGEEAKLAARERELEQQAKSIAARELLVQRLTPAEPAPPPGAGKAYNIDELEQLVAARSAEFPDLAPIWETYLFELRTKAETNGSLPDILSGLVEDVFAPLV